MADPTPRASDGFGASGSGTVDEAPPRGARVGRGAGARDLSRTAAVGLKWSYLSAGANAALQIGYVAAMSRLLSREAFGIMAMSQIVVNFGYFFTTMGMSQTLIQRPVVTAREVRISSTAGGLLGMLCAAAVVAAAPLLAEFYDEPRVVPVLQALSVSFLFIGLGITGAGLLRRQMRFREIAYIDVASSLATMGVGLAAAVAGAGVYSLVAATLAGTASRVVAQYARTRHPVRPLLPLREARSLYASGARFSLLRVTEFLGRNLDTMAVGRYLSSSATGVYSRAYTLVNLSMTRYLSMATAKVLFPSFAVIQGERRRLRRAVGAVLMLAAFVLAPVAAGLSVASPEIVDTVLGRKFAGAVVLLPIFAVGSVLFVLSHIVQLMCEAVGDLDRTLGVQVLSLSVLGVLLVAVSGLDAWAFAAALAAAEAVRHVAYMGQLRRLVDLRLRDLARAYTPALLTAPVVAGAVALARAAVLETPAPVAVALAVEIAAGGLSLLLALRMLPIRALRAELALRLRAAGVADRLGGTPRRVVEWLLRQDLAAAPRPDVPTPREDRT